jgi:hypothetical protein
VALAPGASAGTGETEAVTSFQAPCVAGPGLTNLEWAATITARALEPASVEEGQELSLSGASITFALPVEAGNAFSALGATTVKGTVTNFPAAVTNATPATLNLADSAAFTSGLPFEASVNPNAGLVLAAPSEARTSSWGPLTVTGPPGQRVTLASGAPGFTEVESGEYRETGEGITARVTGYNAEGKQVIGPLTFVCNPPAATLASISIGPGAPTISSVTPEQGPARGGTTVTITGSGFENVSAVEFGSTKASSFTVNSPDELTAVTPSGDQSGYPTDEVEVKVITPRSTTGSQGGHFTYDGPCAPPSANLTGLSPDRGPTTGGGNPVILEGYNLGGVTSVEFGSTSVPVTRIGGQPAVYPPPGSGTVSVSLTVSVAGGCTFTSSTSYTYYRPLTGIEPNGGPAAGGTTVHITGSGFTGATSVEFGGIAAKSFKVESETSITAVTPAGAIGDPLASVTVRAPGGPSSGSDFIYEVGITNITPGSGPTAGGTPVTITGTGIYKAPCELGYCESLQFVGAVKFGSTPAASQYFVSPTELVAVAPPGTGTVDVTVEGLGHTSPRTPADRYTYIPPIEHLTFKGWTVSGSLTPKPLGQAIALPSGSSFNGSGELNTETNNGTVAGAIAVPPFKATPRLLGLIPVSLGMTVTQSGAIGGTIAPSKAVPGDETLTLPVKLNLGFTSIGLLGLNVPTKCTTSQPVSLTLTDTLTKEALLSKGWSFSGTTTIPKITCEGGLLGPLYGETVSGLVAGAGAGYSLTFTAPGS